MDRVLDKKRYYLKMLTIPLKPINFLLVLILAFRGRYPQWMLTPDDTKSPFGVGEKTVEWVYERFGQYFGDVYWLGWRNSLAGIAYKLKPRWLKDQGIQYETLTLEVERNLIFLKQPDGTYLWERTRQFGPFYFISGYRLKPILDGAFENRERLRLGLPRYPRPAKTVNLDGRPIITIRNKNTL